MLVLRFGCVGVWVLVWVWVWVCGVGARMVVGLGM